MTACEASERYHIPLEILREYESWGLCGTVKTVMGAWQYDDTDLERLSMIMTLHDVGFENAEIEAYMKLLLEQEGTETQRLRMLDQKRGRTLDEIHFREKQLERLDYARMEKVGMLPFRLPANDQPITTQAGDLILYLGSSFVIYYAPNSWRFTRLGRIEGLTAQELKKILGRGDVTVTLSLD